ncbi:hypothetical protein WH50_14815 [Pokkaliibacter plantistimulans]|uniref:Transcriptional regulator n=1 Tax=Pokkaliibacter plantistimulans TaxID=1635171 RepID=A0ABX5LV02_9GAMM|nr:response regulator transcription factor [Pokkaliibacter plantistimulans]PXF30502.1 hypothetical protein WH50_14815 [Pokkaliibacter plantistimulans]
MRVLIVEDQSSLAEGLQLCLSDEGYKAEVLDNAPMAIAFLQREVIDLLILDINLKYSSGFDVLNDLRCRDSETPVLILSARNTTEDRVHGLDLGADDYLAKPFDMTELMARVRALLRRRLKPAVNKENMGDLSFDRKAKELVNDRKGESILLPKKEMRIFELFSARIGTLITKAELTDYAYGKNSETDEAVVEVYISRLRKRLEGSGVEIKTVRGLGYLMRVSDI